MKGVLLIILLFLVVFERGYSSTEITVNETEQINLFPNISDADGDVVNYMFSKPLDASGKWQTKYGDAGVYNLTVTASDGKDVVSENITLIVNKREEPPKLVSVSPDVDSIDIKEGESIIFSVDAIDLNMDRLEYLWLLDNENVSEDNSIDFMPGYESSGTHLLAIEVSDGDSSLRKEWEINVQDIDMPPIFSHIPVVVIKENESVYIPLNATDTDYDDIIFEVENSPHGGSLESNLFIWKTDYDTVKKSGLIDALKDKYHILDKTYEINFVAKSRNLSAVQTAVITVKDVNRAPVIDEIPEITVNEGESFEIIPNVSDPDGDTINLGYSGWSSTSGKEAGFNDAGLHNVTVTISDGEFKVSRTTLIRVINVNRMPIFRQLPQMEVNENQTITISLEAEDPDDDRIIFYADNHSYFKSLNIKDNILTWTPDFDVVNKTDKLVNLHVFATDGNLSSSQDISVNVKDTDREPEIINVKPAINSFAYLGDKIVFEVTTTDADNDVLSYKWKTAPFEEYIGSPKLIRKFTTLGRKSISVRVSDGQKESIFIWNVHVINKPKRG